MTQQTLQNDHRVDWEGSTVLGKKANYYISREKEALYVMKFKNINQDQGLVVNLTLNTPDVFVSICTDGCLIILFLVIIPFISILIHTFVIFSFSVGFHI